MALAVYGTPLGLSSYLGFMKGWKDCLSVDALIFIALSLVILLFFVLVGLVVLAMWPRQDVGVSDRYPVDSRSLCLGIAIGTGSGVALGVIFAVLFSAPALIGVGTGGGMLAGVALGNVLGGEKGRA